MKQVFLQKGSAVVHEVPTPLLHEYVVLVRVHYSFISSGTESATLGASGDSLIKKVLKNPAKSMTKLMGAVAENGVQGTMALIKGKQLGEISSIGYSCAGQVIAVGEKIKNLRVGDFVACAGAGIANHADVVAVPENLAVKVSNPENLQDTSITTIGAIAMQGVRRADLRLGDTVCVLGLGLLGQITVQLAKLSGCKVIGMDLDQSRVQLAKELGADIVLNPTKDAIQKEIDFATQHYGVDTTIITAASSSGGVIQQSMEITRRKGKVVLVGDVKLDFDRSPFYAKEIDFLISCSYGPGRYDPFYEQLGNDYPYAYVRWTEGRNMKLFVDLVETGKLKVKPLISQVYTLDKVEQAYASLKDKKGLGLVLSYEPTTDDAVTKAAQVVRNKAATAGASKPYKAPNGDLKVGFVGVGGFAKVKLLPLVKAEPKTAISAIIDADIANATNISRQYIAPIANNDHTTILASDEVDAVVIATPHGDHTDKAIDFMQQGKAVFLEKPASVTSEQLSRLEGFFQEQKEALFCVDFNRSWAPFNQAIKKEVSKRTSPLIVHYRMNAGFIPKTHWIQSEQHGGRIIGEGCHIFELFCFLTDSKPVSVSVESLQPGGDDLLANDNVSAQIRFEDGSCCSLLYTAIGDTTLSKERMEIFFDGKSIVMDDYKELKGFGLPSSFNASTRSVDKGHEALLTRFLQEAKSDNPTHPIPLERLFAATRLSIIIDELARSGGGYRRL